MNLEEILGRLNEPISASIISQKTVPTKKGSYTADFIAWYDLADLLDERAGLGRWSWEIAKVVETPERLVMIGRLSLIGDDRTLSMDASGGEDFNCGNYGDVASNAEAMAMRRAVSKVSQPVRALWRKDGGRGGKQQQKRQTSPAARKGATPEKPKPPAPTAEQMEESNLLLGQLGWGAEKGSAELRAMFGVKSRRQLTADQLTQFNLYLRAQLAPAGV